MAPPRGGEDAVASPVVVAQEASRRLHGLRVAFGAAMAETNRARRLRDAVQPLDALDDCIKREWGFVSRAAPKLIQIATERGLLACRREAWRVACLCEAPGSYPQWILYHTRHHPEVALFGFTLQGGGGFELGGRMVRGAELPLHRFVDLSGASGDVTLPWAAEQFVRRVQDHPSSRCPERGLHLVTADGGLQDHALNQDEANTLALIAGELATALALLEPGGALVCKLFLTESPAMARLLEQASQSFDRVELVKPLASRATNSEKYLVGTGFRGLQRARAWAQGIWGALAAVDEGASPRAKGVAVAAHLEAAGGGVPRPFLRFLARANTEMAQAQAAALEEVLSLPPQGDSRASRVLRGQRSGVLSLTCLWLWGLVDGMSPEAPQREFGPRRPIEM